MDRLDLLTIAMLVISVAASFVSYLLMACIAAAYVIFLVTHVRRLS